MAGETRSQSTKFMMQLFFTKIETFLNGKETLNPSVRPSNNYLLRTYHVFWLKGGIEQKGKTLPFHSKSQGRTVYASKPLMGQKAGTVFDALKLEEISETWKASAASFLTEALL